MSRAPPESLRSSDGSGNELRAITFDPLEVLQYLETGFLSSPLDRWFTGDAPPVLAPSDVIIRPFKNVTSALETARSYLDKKLPEERRRKPDPEVGVGADVSTMNTSTLDVEQMNNDGSRATSEISVTETDLDLADSEREAALERITERNIVLLLEDIVQRCQGIFIPASTAVVRRIEADTTPLINALSSSVVVPTAAETQLAPCVSRERLVVKDNNAILYVALTERSGGPTDHHFVYFLRIEYSGWELDSTPVAIFAAALDLHDDNGEDSPSVDDEEEEEERGGVELLDLAFFDDDTSVLLLRAQGIGYLVQVMHSALTFHTLPDDDGDLTTAGGTGREVWAARFREAVRNGLVSAQGFASLAASAYGRGGVPVRAHALSVCRDIGGGSVAVNGIARREVVLVLDEFGRGQVFDLSQSGDDDEEAEEDDAEGAERG